MLGSYLAACLCDVAELESVDLTVLVVCIWHHAYVAAAGGMHLDAPACDTIVNSALKSLRDIVCSNAAAHTGVDPYGISRGAWSGLFVHHGGEEGHALVEAGADVTKGRPVLLVGEERRERGL